jgi:predicted RNA-binding Zn-ribbon protein involved in translation (DUF1610 family)
MSISDDIGAELDSRKIKNLLDVGKILAEDLASATTVFKCPGCGKEQNVDNLFCDKCGQDIS